MTITTRIIGIAAIVAALLASGCANLPSGSGKTLFVPTADTSQVQLLENDDGKTAVLTGSVKYNFEKKAIEDYVRETYDYTKIVNRITTE